MSNQEQLEEEQRKAAELAQARHEAELGILNGGGTTGLGDQSTSALGGIAGAGLGVGGAAAALNKFGSFAGSKALMGVGAIAGIAGIAAAGILAGEMLKISKESIAVQRETNTNALLMLMKNHDFARDMIDYHSSLRLGTPYNGNPPDTQMQTTYDLLSNEAMDKMAEVNSNKDLTDEQKNNQYETIISDHFANASDDDIIKAHQTLSSPDFLQNYSAQNPQQGAEYQDLMNKYNESLHEISSRKQSLLAANDSAFDRLLDNNTPEQKDKFKKETQDFIGHINANKEMSPEQIKVFIDELAQNNNIETTPLEDAYQHGRADKILQALEDLLQNINLQNKEAGEPNSDVTSNPHVIGGGRNNSHLNQDKVQSELELLQSRL